MKNKYLALAVISTMALSMVTTSAFAAKPTPNDAPTVDAFTVATDSASPVPILTFSASDTDGTVAVYLVTESTSAPSANDSGWSATPQTDYATASTGSVQLCGWAMDDKDEISVPVCNNVNILPPAVDADTLQGHPASDFADAVHGHFYGNMTVVATSGGEYTSPIDAVTDVSSWCGVPSATNPCLVKIMPGVYDINSDNITLPDYVDMTGSGPTNTKIIGRSSGMNVLGKIIIGSSTLSSLTLEMPGSGSMNTGVSCSGQEVNVQLRDVDIINNGGVQSRSFTCTPNDLSSVIFTNVNITTIHSFGTTARGIVFYNNYGTNYRVIIDNVSVTVAGGSGSSGTDAVALGVGGNTNITNSTFTASDGTNYNRAADVYSSSNVSIANSSFISRGLNTVGVRHGGPIMIEKSIILSDYISIEGNAGRTDDTALVVNSRIEGPLGAAGTFKCLNVYDGNVDPIVCP